MALTLAEGAAVFATEGYEYDETVYQYNYTYTDENGTEQTGTSPKVMFTQPIEQGESHSISLNGLSSCTEKDDNGEISISNGYYLTEDITLSEEWNVPGEFPDGGILCLDLNGHTLKLEEGKKGSVIDINYGTLYLFDTSENGTGMITGGTGYDGSYGGGVWCYQRGIFNMYGGTISGNTAENRGGGVYMGDPGNYDSIFNMYGGTISGNKTTSGDGGGVYLEQNSEFNMYGGTISGNEAEGNGGGVFNYHSATTEIAGGTISGNKAGSDGGGIYNNTSATVAMYGGTISGNAASGKGGGIYVDQTAEIDVRITGVEISGNKADSEGGGIYIGDNNNVTMSEVTINDNIAETDGGGIYSCYASVDMSEITVSGNQAGEEGGGVYAFYNVAVKITDGNISGNEAGNDGGGVYSNYNTEFSVSGAPVIYGNTLQSGISNDVCLGNDVDIITIADDGMKDGTKIGVNRPFSYLTNYGTVTKGFGTYHSADAGTAIKYFIANPVKDDNGAIKAIEKKLTGEDVSQEIALYAAEHEWSFEEEGNDVNEGKVTCKISCTATSNHDCEHKSGYTFTFDASECAGQFDPDGTKPARIYIPEDDDTNIGWEYVKQFLIIYYAARDNNGNYSGELSMKPPKEVGNYRTALYLIDKDPNADSDPGISFSIDPIDIELTIPIPEGSDDLSGFIGSFSGGNEGYTLPDVVESVTVAYQDEGGTEIEEGTAGYDTKYTAVVTLKLKEGYPDNSVGDVITINGNEISNCEKEFGDDRTVSSVKAIYDFTTGKRTIPVDKDGDGNVADADKNIEVPEDSDGDGIYEQNVDNDANIEKLIPVDMDGNEDSAIDHYVPSDVLQDNDDNGIYAPVSEEVKDSEGNTPEYIGIDGNDADKDPDRFIKVTDENDDGVYKDGTGNEYIPVDTDADQAVDEYIKAKDEDENGDKDGIYKDDTGKEHLPIDDNGDGEKIERYVPKADLADTDSDGVYTDEKDRNYVPVDMESDGEPNHYVWDEALEKGDDDIYTPEDWDGNDEDKPKYIGKNTDEDADPEKFIKVTEDSEGNYKDDDGNVYLDVDTNGDGTVDEKDVPAKDSDDDEFYDADVVGDEDREKLIPVDMGGDGVVDHYIPEGVLVDDTDGDDMNEDINKDGIYTPVDENGSPLDEPKYYGKDEDGNGEPEKFVKLTGPDDDGIYEDTADNKYIPVDEDGDGDVDGIVEVKDNEDNSDGIYGDDANNNGTYDEDGDTQYIPVDMEGDGTIEHYIPEDVLIDAGDEGDKDGIYTPVDENGSPKTEPEYIGIDETGGTNEDGDKIPDGKPEKFIKVEDRDGDGIYGDDANGDETYDGDSDENGEEDNHYIPVDTDGDGDADKYVQAEDIDGDGIYEDDDRNKYIPVDMEGDGVIEHYIPEDVLIDAGNEGDKDGIYTPVDENGSPKTEPEYIGIDETGGTNEDGDKIPDGKPEKFIKVEDRDVDGSGGDGIYGDDANGDGNYDGDSNANGEEDNHYVPVDTNSDGNVDKYVQAEDSDGDGIYGDDANGDGNYDGDSDANGEEDNHYIPVDTDGDGDVDVYIQAEDSDGDGIYGDDANNDGAYDGPANEVGNEDKQYIPVDTDSDGTPNHYVPDGVLKDSDNDGIYEGKDDKEYIPVDKDGDGDIDIFIDKEKLTEDSDGDGLKEVDIDGDNTKEELIPVDMDGDGDTDHYIPDDVLVDDTDGDDIDNDTKKDGIYTPKDPDNVGKVLDEPEYIGIDENDDNKPDKFIKVEDSDGDGVYGDDANGNGTYDDDEEKDGKKDNKYIPVDTDYDPNTPDEFIEVTPEDNGSYTGKDDENTYIPVDDGDGGTEFIEVTPNEDDGSYTDENGTGSDTSDDKTYIPVDADADGDVDEFVEVKDIDGKYKDDDDGDEIFGGEGDYTYKPINDDGDDKPDRYVTEDAVAEDGHAHTVGTPATCTEAAKCGVENCGEYYGKPLGHNYGDWRKVNGTKHKRECEREGCEYEMEGNHYPELECGANAASCDICGATAAGDHTFSNEWSSDKTGHWKGCIHCGTKNPESVATHNYPNQNAGDGVSQTCLTCGYGGHITRVTADDSFEDYYIPQTLKNKFSTPEDIKTKMKDKAKEGNSDLSDDEVWLFDAVLEYSIDGGITWKPASEDYFPKKADGTYDVLPVKIPVPEETNIADYEYKVYHMFTSNKFKEVGGPGYIEQPIVTEEKGDAECDRGYISFYVKGLSPIMVVWEKTASDTAGGGGGSTGPEEGNGPEPRTIPDQDGDNKPEPDTNDDGIYDGTRDDDKKYVKDEDGNIEEVTDPDGDGIYDGEDRDGDGKPDKRYIADQDGDGIPEPDTDGDGIFEGTKDDKRYGTGENDRRNKDNSDKKTYEFVDGKLIWIKGSTKDLTFTIDAPAKKFKKLIIGGETVGKGHYSYVSGSTIVTVDADYLNSMKLGSYEVKAVYTDGKAVTTLKVKAAAGAAASGTDTGSGNSAGTGDDSNLLLWMMIATAAAAGGVGTLIPRRRRSH